MLRCRVEKSCQHWRLCRPKHICVTVLRRTQNMPGTFIYVTLQGSATVFIPLSVLSTVGTLNVCLIQYYIARPLTS